MANRRWSQALAVFAGGTLGTLARALVLDSFGHDPLALTAVNLSGCLALGGVVGWFGPRQDWAQTFLAVGVIASFTSWSSLAVSGIISPARLAGVVIEALLGVGFAGVGHLAGRRLAR